MASRTRRMIEDIMSGSIQILLRVADFNSFGIVLSLRCGVLCALCCAAGGLKKGTKRVLVE